MRNARFWVYANGGPVKLTLKPGQELRHSEGGPTEEGWHVDATRWWYTLHDLTVHREWFSDGVDCDGRLSRGGEDECDILHLQSGNYPYYNEDDPAEAAIWDGVRYPEWVEASPNWQYDEFAAKAGY